MADLSIDLDFDTDSNTVTAAGAVDVNVYGGGGSGEYDDTALVASVATKAAQTALDAATADISDNADDIAALTTVVDGKATITALETLETAVDLNTAKISFNSTASSKLDGIQAGAQVNLTTEELQDLIAAMFTGGTNSGLSVSYNDTARTIGFTVSGGGGGSLSQEEVEDYIGGVLSGASGINVDYDDANNSISVSLAGESYSTADKNKLTALPTNASLTSSLAGKANASQVLTDVPENAVFTDTVYDDTAIQAEVDANTLKRSYPSADETKLSGIETGATADQTGAEIKSLYEAEDDTNALTDALLSKLNAIEAGATADQTGAQIKSAYEGESNTNAFTDAEKTKLSNAVTSTTSGLQIVQITQTAYDALTPDAATLYVITE